jgi:hypothetical protein
MAVRDRVTEHRKRLRAQGLRPVQYWVPEVRTPEFAAEARRQALVVAESDAGSDDQDFIEAVSADWGRA